MSVLRDSPLARPHLLKIKAVNFLQTVLDTEDLSTIRGSSLAILRGPGVIADRLREELSGVTEVREIYRGASEVLLELLPHAAATAAGDERAAASESGEAPGRRPFARKSPKQWRELLEEWLDKPAAVDLDDLAHRCFTHLAKNPKNLAARDDSGQELTVDELRRQFKALRADRAAAAHGSGSSPDDVDCDNARLDALCDHVRSLLAEQQGEWPLQLFTFAVATAPTPEPRQWRRAQAHLESRLGAEQYRRLTVSLPPLVRVMRPAAEAVCAFTGTHPSDHQRVLGSRVSASVAARRRGGREQKQLFYLQQLAVFEKLAGAVQAPEAAKRLSDCRERLRAHPAAFAASFEDIVAPPAEDLPPNVRGKLAVVYLDGNNLSKRREAASKSPAELGRFSAQLSLAQAELLATIVDWLVDQPGMVLEGTVDPDTEQVQPRFRFETLLWGGDEMAFVLPSWHGVAFIGALLDGMARMHLAIDDQFVTHGVGAVFANVKSPISGLIGAAEELAGAAKAKSSDGQSVERNDVQMMALEGIDRAELDVCRLRSTYFVGGGALSQDEFSIPGGDWPSLLARVERAEACGCRTQLHRQLRHAIDQRAIGCDPDHAAAQQLRNRLRELELQDAERALFEGEGFGRGANRHPFIPVWQYLTLADYFRQGRLE